MSTTGLAVFFFVGFLLPVPLLHWLDRPRAAPRPGPDPSHERAG